MSGLLARWHNLSKRTQWIAAVGVILLALAGIGAFSGTDESTSSSSSSDAVVAEVVEEIIDEAVEESFAPVEEAFSSESSGQENARQQAENYLNSSAFSRKGLIEQLKYEGYSTAEATYAVDNISVDWSEQAALKAGQYLDTSAFSRSGLMEQLLYEGFTRAQASYGVSVAY